MGNFDHGTTYREGLGRSATGGVEARGRASGNRDVARRQPRLSVGSPVCILSDHILALVLVTVKRSNFRLPETNYFSGDHV